MSVRSDSPLSPLFNSAANEAISRDDVFPGRRDSSRSSIGRAARNVNVLETSNVARNALVDAPSLPLVSPSFPPYRLQGQLIDFRKLHEGRLQKVNERDERERKAGDERRVNTKTTLKNDLSLERLLFASRVADFAVARPRSFVRDVNAIRTPCRTLGKVVTSFALSNVDLVDSWIKSITSPRKYDLIMPPLTPLLNFDPRAVLSELFSQLKNMPNDIFLTQFIKDFPKAILHSHLAGEIHWEDLLICAASADMYVDQETLVFSKYKKKEGDVSAKDLLEIPHKELRERLRKAMCVSQCSHAEPDRFFNSFTTIASITENVPLSELLKLYLAIALQENIQYAELMIERPAPKLPEEWSKLFSEMGNSEQGWQELYAFLKDRKWIDQHTQFRAKEIDEELSLALQDRKPGEKEPTLRFIIQIYRHLPLMNFFAELVAAMALVKESKLCVGINLVGPEHQALAIKNYDVHMKMIAFLRTIYPDVRVSLHAGESTRDLSRNAGSHIGKAIKIAKPERIGHASNATAEDIALMIDTNTVVEFCPSSCETILGVSIEKGPIGAFLKAGVQFTINPDDAGVAGATSSIIELVKVTRALNLDYATLRKIMLNGIKHSFADDRANRIKEFKREWRTVESRVAYKILRVYEQGPAQMLPRFSFNPLLTGNMSRSGSGQRHLQETPSKR